MMGMSNVAWPGAGDAEASTLTGVSTVDRMRRWWVGLAAAAFLAGAALAASVGLTGISAQASAPPAATTSAAVRREPAVAAAPYAQQQPAAAPVLSPYS